MKQIDTLITGGTIVTMDSAFRLLEGHSIAIENGVIINILPDSEDCYQAQEVIDASNCLIIPGLINAHTHLPMTYFRGMADDMPLDKWLQDYIWPLEAKLVNPQFVFDAAVHGASEMIKNGITFANDMYFHMGSIADACTKAGLRVIISEALIEHALSSEDRNNYIGKKLAQLSDHYRTNPLVSFSLAPHSIYTCSQDTLSRCAEVAKEHNWLIHTHLSESKQEVENCQKEHGKRPLEYLADLGFLELRCLFAHGIWLDDTELKLLSNSKSSICVCTDSNLKLGSGFAPLGKMSEYKVNFCLGTDGVASNNNLDLLAEMDTTAKLHKLLWGDISLFNARDTLAMVTSNAAKALGMADKVGSLEIGKYADITILNTNDLECQPLYNPYSQIVYAMTSWQVRDVLISGKLVLKDKQLTMVDESMLIETAKSYRHQILKEITV